MEKKLQNIITDKLGIDSDIEIDRCHRIGPPKAKTGQDRDDQQSDLTDLMIARYLKYCKETEKHGYLYL